MGPSSRNFGFLSLSSAFHLLLIFGVLAINMENPIPPNHAENIEVSVLNQEGPDSTKGNTADGDAAKPESLAKPAVAEASEKSVVSDKSDNQKATSTTLKSQIDVPEETISAQAPQKEVSAREISPVLGNENSILSVAKISSEDVDSAMIDSVVDEIPVENSDDPIVNSLSHLEETTQREATQSQQLAETITNENNQKMAALAEADIQRQANERKKTAQIIAAQKFNEQQAAQRLLEQEQASTSAGSAATSVNAESSAPAVGSESTGTNNSASPGARAIGELKQMPGNPKPQFDDEDRLFNRKGTVIFEAFVTKEGSLQNFKMLSSSGHRELDAKTLKALKKWKFYPGQAGLVEIPIQWDLVGGAKEIKTSLRRSTVVK